MLQNAHIRIARPTSQLERVVRFYTDILGFRELGRFEDHSGFDGVMVGFPESSYHLEFTHCHAANENHDIAKPSEDDLLVFYVPSSDDWNRVIDRIKSHGIESVPSFNPYWDKQGLTFSDPDGYRIVIHNSRWP